MTQKFLSVHPLDNANDFSSVFFTKQRERCRDIHIQIDLAYNSNYLKHLSSEKVRKKTAIIIATR